jgi:hypothetical protein
MSAPAKLRVDRAKALKTTGMEASQNPIWDIRSMLSMVRAVNASAGPSCIRAVPDGGIIPGLAVSYYGRDRIVRSGCLYREDAMMKFRLASFCLAALTLAACAQASTDAAKASADKPTTAQTGSATPYPYPGSGDHSGGGGGEGGGGY